MAQNLNSLFPDAARNYLAGGWREKEGCYEQAGSADFL